MSGRRTIWHPSFARLLTQRAPHWAVVRSEVQLGDEPLIVDDLIELRADQAHDPNDRGETLRGLWPHIRRVGLTEFKSVSRAPTLEEQLQEVGIVLPEATDGYHVVADRGLKLVVVDVTAAANAEDDDLLRWFGRETPRTVATRQLGGQ